MLTEGRRVYRQVNECSVSRSPKAARSAVFRLNPPVATLRTFTHEVRDSALPGSGWLDGTDHGAVATSADW